MYPRRGLRGRGFGRGLRLGRGFNGGNGRLRAGYDPVCECPNCGHQMSHEPSIPCTEYTCPECGTPMRGAACFSY